MAADLPPPLPEPLEACVAQASDAYSVAPDLIQAVMYRESSYNPKAIVSRKTFKALGLMQINTRYWLGEVGQYGISQDDLINRPCVNVAVGTWILRRFYLRYDNWFDALAAYNAGHSYENRKHGFGYAKNVIASWRALYDQERKAYVATSTQ